MPACSDRSRHCPSFRSPVARRCLTGRHAVCADARTHHAARAASQPRHGNKPCQLRKIMRVTKWKLRPVVFSSRRFLSWRIYHMLAIAAMRQGPTSMNLRSDFAWLTQVSAHSVEAMSLPPSNDRCVSSAPPTSRRRGVEHNREASEQFNTPRRTPAARPQKHCQPFGDAGP